MKKHALLILTLSTGLLFASCKSATNTASDAPVTEEQAAMEWPKGYAIGDVATDFSLPAISGSNVSLADFTEAKGFILTFTCNHCPYAKKYEDRINALDAKYAALGYPVIAINPNDPDVQSEDSFEKMKERAADKGFTFPYLWDKDQSIYPQYGATRTPHVYILEKQDGKNIVRYIGAIDDNYRDANDVSKRYVEDAVNALLEGKEVPVTETKAIGCSIKDKRKS